MLKVKYLLHILQPIRTSTVQGGGEKLLRPFLSALCRLAENSIQKHLKKGRCPKTFFPGF